MLQNRLDTIALLAAYPSITSLFPFTKGKKKNEMRENKLAWEKSEIPL